MFPNNELEKKMSNISIGPLSNYIASEDYKSVFQLLSTVKIELIKGHLREILLTLKTEEKISKFIGSLVDILKNDMNNWNAIDNIKTVFNELEEVYLSVFSTGKGDKSTIESLNSIIEKVFSNYINEVEMQLQKYTNINNQDLFQLSSVLLNFTQLLDIKSYESILYPMAQFGERLFHQYNNVSQLQPLIVEFILHINHRLVNYLAVVPGNPVSKGLKESIYIYDAVRNNIVTLNYSHPEIITKALNILEHRSRFFGLTADAIPENENHGDYIVVDPLNTAFEDDDVYDDYERFLANLPN